MTRFGVLAKSAGKIELGLRVLPQGVRFPDPVNLLTGHSRSANLLLSGKRSRAGGRGLVVDCAQTGRDTG